MNCWNEMNSCLCKYGYVFCIAFESDNWTIGVSEHWRGVSRCISRYGLVFCICICIRISKQWVDVSRCGFGSSSIVALLPTRRPPTCARCSHSYNWYMMSPYAKYILPHIAFFQQEWVVQSQLWFMLWCHQALFPLAISHSAMTGFERLKSSI